MTGTRSSPAVSSVKPTWLPSAPPARMGFVGPAGRDPVIRSPHAPAQLRAEHAQRTGSFKHTVRHTHRSDDYACAIRCLWWPLPWPVSAHVHVTPPLRLLVDVTGTISVPESIESTWCRSAHARCVHEAAAELGMQGVRMDARGAKRYYRLPPPPLLVDVMCTISVFDWIESIRRIDLS